jgi:hypothetical protein
VTRETRQKTTHFETGEHRPFGEAGEPGERRSQTPRVSELLLVGGRGNCRQDVWQEQVFSGNQCARCWASGGTIGSGRRRARSPTDVSGQSHRLLMPRHRAGRTLAGNGRRRETIACPPGAPRRRATILGRPHEIVVSPSFRTVSAMVLLLQLHYIRRESRDCRVQSPASSPLIGIFGPSVTTLAVGSITCPPGRTDIRRRILRRSHRRPARVS